MDAKRYLSSSPMKELSSSDARMRRLESLYDLFAFFNHKTKSSQTSVAYNYNSFVKRLESRQINEPIKDVISDESQNKTLELDSQLIKDMIEWKTDEIKNITKKLDLAESDDLNLDVSIDQNQQMLSKLNDQIAERYSKLEQLTNRLANKDSGRPDFLPKLNQQSTDCDAVNLIMKMCDENLVGQPASDLDLSVIASSIVSGGELTQNITLGSVGNQSINQTISNRSVNETINCSFNYSLQSVVPEPNQVPEKTAIKKINYQELDAKIREEHDFLPYAIKSRGVKYTQESKDKLRSYLNHVLGSIKNCELNYLYQSVDTFTDVNEETKTLIAIGQKNFRRLQLRVDSDYFDSYQDFEKSMKQIIGKFLELFSLRCPEKSQQLADVIKKVEELIHENKEQAPKLIAIQLNHNQKRNHQFQDNNSKKFKHY